MAKFKVGDKVRIRNDLKAGEYLAGLYIARDMVEMAGRVCTVNVVDKDSDYLLREAGYWWSDDMLEPVSPKDLLKPGYLVDTRSGHQYVVAEVGHRSKLFLSGTHCEGNAWTRLVNYSDDLKNRAIPDGRLDVMTIYGPFRDRCNFSVEYPENNRILIWERPEEVKEMTVSEIEKILGYKVEVIAEKED